MREYRVNSLYNGEGVGGAYTEKLFGIFLVGCIIIDFLVRGYSLICYWIESWYTAPSQEGFQKWLIALYMMLACPIPVAIGPFKILLFCI